MKYSDVQLRVLADVYEAEDGIVLTGVHKRTVEVLARDRLVTYQYIRSKTRRGCDNLRVHKAKSARLCAKAMKLIELRGDADEES